MGPDLTWPDIRTLHTPGPRDRREAAAPTADTHTFAVVEAPQPVVLCEDDPT